LLSVGHIPTMITDYRWVLLGAASGDALAMSSEAEAPHTERPIGTYRHPSKWHPNASLSPGQFTDDTQMMMIVADLFAENNFSNRRYADALCEAWKKSGFVSLMVLSLMHAKRSALEN